MGCWVMVYPWASLSSLTRNVGGCSSADANRRAPHWGRPCSSQACSLPLTSCCGPGPGRSTGIFSALSLQGLPPEPVHQHRPLLVEPRCLAVPPEAVGLSVPVLGHLEALASQAST